jgi:hypothetical protein
MVGEPRAETPTLVKLIWAESAMSTFHFAASTEVMIQIKTNLSRAYTTLSDILQMEASTGLRLVGFSSGKLRMVTSCFGEMPRNQG